eukprot:340551-Amphidinium_carterae.1
MAPAKQPPCETVLSFNKLCPMGMRALKPQPRSTKQMTTISSYSEPDHAQSKTNTSEQQKQLFDSKTNSSRTRLEWQSVVGGSKARCKAAGGLVPSSPPTIVPSPAL